MKSRNKMQMEDIPYFFFLSVCVYICILTLCRSRIQSLILFPTVQKETSKTPRILEEGQLPHLSAELSAAALSQQIVVKLSSANLS